MTRLDDPTTSFINSNSERCFTAIEALHLAALDAPKRTAKEVTGLLLLAGLDTSAPCAEGQSPADIALSEGNEDFLAACEEYRTMHSVETVLHHYEALKEDLNQHYCLQFNTKTRGLLCLSNAR